MAVTEQTIVVCPTPRHGPTLRVFDALDTTRQARLIADLEALLARHIAADDGTTAVPAEYLEAVAARR